MLSAADQLRNVERHLLRSGGVYLAPPVASIDAQDQIGRLDAVLGYPSGHQFHVTLTLDVLPGYPLWIHYRFHLQDQRGRCVFRYDNTPHYRQMATFPHHKHIGSRESPRESLQPGIRQIVAEVAEEVGNSTHSR